MKPDASDREALEKIRSLAAEAALDLSGGRVRRTSSRFCLGVEHGDYNGTELFGVGTDRFLWFAYKPNDTGRIRLFSGNVPGEGVVEFVPGRIPPAFAPEIADRWARFPFGVDFVLRRAGITLSRGLDGVVFGNIPGGGMSRSAALSVNLILSFLEADGREPPERMEAAKWAQAVENAYIGSPCGLLDQVMILFAREGAGTHYDPANETVRYVPLGSAAPEFRLVCLDTGTVRPGLEKSTYRIRRAECEELVDRARKPFGITCLADVREEELFRRITARFEGTHPHLCARLRYIYHAQRRFREMLGAWERGDLATVGRVFREDGLGLRDDYRISGPELETMCDIARTVPGVLGERMLGGGDKGAAGAIVSAGAVDALRAAVDTAYPRSRPACADRYAVHVLRPVEGVALLEGLL